MRILVGPLYARGLVAAAVTLGALLLAAAVEVEATPSGYYVVAVEAASARPTTEIDTTGDYTVSIQRECPDSLAARLLGIAEATYPPRELLMRIAEWKSYELGSDAANGALWWCDGVGAARVPYAITAGALEHYRNLTREYRERAFRDPMSRRVYTSKLVYRASVERRDELSLADTSYRNVYVAHLRLDWSYDDGTFEPLTEAWRVVVLKPDGSVLRVDGDGVARAEVAISTRRQAGRGDPTRSR